MSDMMDVMTEGCRLHRQRDIKIVQPEDLMIAFVAVAHLVIDCRIVCKEWTKNTPWRHLDAMVFSLLKEMIRRYSYSEEPGVAMYERFCEVWDRYAQK